MFGLTGAGDAFRRVNNILWGNVWLNLLLGSILIADIVQPDTPCVVRILDAIVGTWAFIAAVKARSAANDMIEVKEATLSIFDDTNKETDDA